MATNPTTYPKIGKKVWFQLRERLKKSIPGNITPTYVISVAPMAEASARSNVISPLRELGLIDETGTPTALAERWRHDDDYVAVCHEILNKVYPKTLTEAYPDADSSKKELIKNWFMREGNVGEVAAKMYADTYILLSQADLSKSDERAVIKASPRNPTTQAKKIKTVVATTENMGNPTLHVPPVETPPHRRMPAIHIDVQVHISPDTSAEQIDRIFESMGKHLGSYIR